MSCKHCIFERCFPALKSRLPWKVQHDPRAPNRLLNNAYIFTGRNGVPFRDIKGSFASALRKAGIKDFKFHDLRHTFASHLVMEGVDLNTVKELLGHKTLAMTFRYAHLAPGHKARAVSVMEKPLEENLTIQFGGF